jgi:hypothetical protein
MSNEDVETPVTKRVPHDTNNKPVVEVIDLTPPGVDLAQDVAMYGAMGLLTQQELNDFKASCALRNKK